MTSASGKIGDARTPWPVFLGYGSGDFALNLFWQGTGFYLFFFYTNVLGLAGTTVGTIFLVASVWDAISDPMMGYIAERGQGRWGRYRTYVRYGALPLSVSFALLFTPQHLVPAPWLGAYALGTLVLFRTAYTVVSIPYSALSARITEDSDARTRLAGTRMYFGFLGGISISFLAKRLQGSFSDAEAFHFLGVSAGVAATLILLICCSLTKETVPHQPQGQAGPSVWARLGAMRRNRPFLLITSGIMLVTVATSLVGQTMLYFFESHYSDRAAGNSALMIMGGAPLVTIPLWSAVTLRIGKRWAWILGGLIGSAGCLLLYVCAGLSPAWALAAVAILVVGLSAYAVLFWSMLPDTIEYGHYRSGVRSESFLIGIASSFQKVAIGLSAFLAGTLLDRIGFRGGHAFSPATTDGIRDIITLIPMAALALSSVVIFFYPITAEVHAELVVRLKSRLEDDGPGTDQKGKPHA